MDKIKQLLITTTLTTLLLFGCANEQNNEEFTPGPSEEEIEEPIVQEEDVEEEVNVNEITSRLAALTNKDFIANYHPEYQQAVDTEGVDIHSIHNNLIESDIIIGDNEQLLNLMLDLESELNNQVSNNPIVIDERNVINEIVINEDESTPESFDDIVAYPDVPSQLVNSNKTHIIVLDKRIEDVVLNNDDSTVGASSIQLIDTVRQLSDDFKNAENPLSTMVVLQIVYENDDYVIAVKPDAEIYTMGQSEENLMNFLDRFKSEAIQNIFDQHLSK